MNPQVFLIQAPNPDIAVLLQITGQALGRNLASHADASCLKHTPADKFLSCLSEMQEGPSELRQHVFYSVLVLGLEDDLFEILETCSMPYVTAETTRRGVFVAVVSGTLDQWERACGIGCKQSSSDGIRLCFDAISGLFIRAYKRLT